jgi:hypothetical protein
MDPVAKLPDERPGPDDQPAPSRRRESWGAQLAGLIRAIVNADPAAIEAAARDLGESRRMLTPLAWAASTIVLLLQGIKLLIMNWRLSLIQLVPATWVWLATWDLKRHLLHGGSFAHLTFFERLALAAAVVAYTIAAFWCNTVFAYAIDGPPPPRIAPAFRKARQGRRTVLAAGLVIGTALALAVVVVPRYVGVWLFSLTLGAVLAVMLISFVAVPARILGVKKQQKLPPREALGRAAAGGTLSAVAMAPGFLLGRIGLILLGLQHFHVLGFALLSIGTALYAAGMSSVKVVKLSMKLSTSPPA